MLAAVLAKMYVFIDVFCIGLPPSRLQRCCLVFCAMPCGWQVQVSDQNASLHVFPHPIILYDGLWLQMELYYTIWGWYMGEAYSHTYGYVKIFKACELLTPRRPSQVRQTKRHNEWPSTKLSPKQVKFNTCKHETNQLQQLNVHLVFLSVCMVTCSSVGSSDAKAVRNCVPVDPNPIQNVNPSAFWWTPYKP